VLLPGAGTASDVTVTAALYVLYGSLAWFASRLYRERRVDIMSLGESWRVLLYVAIGVAFLTLTATRRLWDTGAGTAAWFALVGACGAAAYSVWRSTQLS